MTFDQLIQILNEIDKVYFTLKAIECLLIANTGFQLIHLLRDIFKKGDK